MTSFDDAQAYLDALGIDVMKKMRPNTERIEALCEALDHPERSAPAMHITGTNGKTSTAAIATSLLAATGLSVGTYTSPHLQSVRERIALNGQSVGENEFGEVFEHILPFIELVEQRLDDRLTYFEVLTAMFFLWAAERPVEAMVVEVGLGGRWDATNVVDASVAVITNVGLDHTGLLGMDRETIAREKAGIIKPEAQVVTAERTPSVLQAISEEADKQRATLVGLERDFSVADNRIAVGGRYLSISTSVEKYEGLFLPLHGSHQGVNAVVALEAGLRFLSKPLDHEVVSQGFAEAKAPGRLETVRLHGDEAVPVVVDVAHNPDGMSALVTSLLEAFAFERAVFVIGILADKDYRGMLTELTRIPCSLIATKPGNVRSVDVDELAGVANELGLECVAEPDVATATDMALDEARTADLVCITGSHYAVGEARAILVGD
ncbi:MAG: dihydrofolate synthase [Actinobacteria bacterium]|nr:dihydrofolate synthase [Actinomycetota bacterium]